jgi:hypothetical protein
MIQKRILSLRLLNIDVKMSILPTRDKGNDVHHGPRKHTDRKSTRKRRMPSQKIYAQKAKEFMRTCIAGEKTPERNNAHRAFTVAEQTATSTKNPSQRNARIKNPNFGRTRCCVRSIVFDISELAYERFICVVETCNTIFSYHYYNISRSYKDDFVTERELCFLLEPSSS